MYSVMKAENCPVVCLRKSKGIEIASAADRYGQVRPPALPAARRQATRGCRGRRPRRTPRLRRARHSDRHPDLFDFGVRVEEALDLFRSNSDGDTHGKYLLSVGRPPRLMRSRYRAISLGTPDRTDGRSWRGRRDIP